MNLPFFNVEAYVPKGGLNQADKKSKNAFQPVPVPRSTFPVSPSDTKLLRKSLPENYFFGNVEGSCAIKISDKELCVKFVTFKEIISEQFSVHNKN